VHYSLGSRRFGGIYACSLKVVGRTVGCCGGFVAMYRERVTSHEAVISMETAMITSNLTEILLFIVLQF